MSEIKQRNNMIKLNRRSAQTEVSKQKIRERAYQIFLARGASHGADVADWLRAEQELHATSQR